MDLLTMKYAETISEKKNVMFRQPRVSVFFRPTEKRKHITYGKWKRRRGIGKNKRKKKRRTKEGKREEQKKTCHSAQNQDKKIIKNCCISDIWAPRTAYNSFIRRFIPPLYPAFPSEICTSLSVCVSIGSSIYLTVCLFV